MPKVKDLLDNLKAFKPNESIAYAFWVVEDVINEAENQCLSITKKEAKEILETVHDDQDSDCGITWAFVADKIREHLQNKKEMRQNGETK